MPTALSDGRQNPRPLGHEVVTEGAVDLRGEPLVGRPRGEPGLVEGWFEEKDAFSQQRGYFGIGEDAPCGFDETGGAIRSSISCRKRISTGSCSKAMLCATSWGIACQRRRSFSSSGRLRHR